MTEGHNTILPEDEERQQILNFTKHVLSQRTGNYTSLKQSIDGTVFPAIRGETCNRGNKLYQHAEMISQRRLRADQQTDSVFYSGSEHNILSRKRMKFTVRPQAIEMNNVDASQSREGLEEVEDEEEEEEQEDDDLHNLVNVQKILSPISSLADVATHVAISRTFKSKVLKNLALDIISMIKKEQQSVISYGCLLEVFLGDTPEPLLEDALNLPDYDHNLQLKFDEESPSSSIAAVAASATAKINATQERTRKSNKAESVKKDNTNEEEDPFFALPKFKDSDKWASMVDTENNENSEEIETTRQLVQIALQRNQEFIRNLQKIRNCIVKSNRIRERILMWGREYAGIPEEDVTVPSALHIVKRGLISATTNHMDEAAEDDDVDEE